MLYVRWHLRKPCNNKVYEVIRRKRCVYVLKLGGGQKLMTDPRYIGTILYVSLSIFAVLLVAGLCVGALSCVLSKALFAAMPKNAPGRVNQYKLFKK